MRNAKRTLARQRLPGTLLLLGTASAFAAAAFVAADAAATAPVRGKIAGQEKLLPDVYVDAAKDPHRYSWRDVSPTVGAQFRVLSANPSREICVAAFSSGDQNPHEAVLVRVTGGRTIPTTIVVPPGTRLAFKNIDPFAHRLYQVNEPKWAASTTNAGVVREWTASNVGRFEFRDELFPSVKTFVVVDKQVVDFVYPDKDGGFVMNLPQGDYVLKVFFAGKQVGHDVNGVHIGAHENPVELKDPINVGGDAK